MAESTRSLTIKLAAQDDGATAAIKKVGQSLTGAFGSGGGSVLSQLKAGFGRGSDFTQGLKALSGGGAVLGLNLAAREIDAFADKAVQLRKDFQEGSKSAGQIGEELAKSIPVYGQIFDAGRKFRSLVDGTADDLARLERENTFTKIVEEQIAAMKRLQKVREEGEDATRKVRNAGDLVGMVDPGKTLLQLKQEEEDTKLLIDRANRDRTQVDEKHAKEIADSTKAAQTAAQRVTAAREALADAREHGYAPGNLADELQQAEIEKLSTEGRFKQAVAAKANALKTTLSAALDPLNAKLDLLRKERDATEDAANAEQERRELAHWATMNTIRTKAQEEALKDQGKTVAAEIARLQGEYAAAEAAENQRFKEAFREAMHGGPLSPEQVGSNEQAEAAGRKQAYNDAVRHAVAGGIVRTVTGALGDAGDSIKSKLHDWPQKLLYAAGLSGPKFGQGQTREPLPGLGSTVESFGSSGRAAALAESLSSLASSSSPVQQTAKNTADAAKNTADIVTAFKGFQTLFEAFAQNIGTTPASPTP